MWQLLLPLPEYETAALVFVNGVIETYGGEPRTSLVAGVDTITKSIEACVSRDVVGGVRHCWGHVSVHHRYEDDATSNWPTFHYPRHSVHRYPPDVTRFLRVLDFAA